MMVTVSLLAAVAEASVSFSTALSLTKYFRPLFSGNTSGAWHIGEIPSLRLMT